jgi:putative transposase
MPRSARATPGGYRYHVLNRGNRRAEVFHGEGDYDAFVHLLAHLAARLPVRLVAFCLMPIHFHLVLWPVGDHDRSVCMHWLLTTHASHYQKHHRAIGHVWQGRFKAFPVEDDRHLYTVLRYVERNALRANMVGRAEDWRWGSLWCHERADAQAQGRLDLWPVPRPADWAAMAKRGANRSRVGGSAAVGGSRESVWFGDVVRADSTGIGPAGNATAARAAAQTSVGRRCAVLGRQSSRSQVRALEKSCVPFYLSFTSAHQALSVCNSGNIRR